MLKVAKIFIVFQFSFILLFSQENKNTIVTVSVINNETQNSYRGLSVVTNKILWVSGSNGTVGKSVDGGKTFKFYKVKGYEKIDFRDIEAFDEAKAIIMGIASPGYILKTIDGGETWQLKYENKDTSTFMDAMHFWNDESGIVLGDPINNQFLTVRTFSNGDEWQTLDTKICPTALKGEACFASSGTNIKALSKKEHCFVTGGLISRFHSKNGALVLPIMQGTETTGANSIAINKKNIVIVGGDFNNKDRKDSSVCYSENKGKTWKISQTMPNGYKSCVTHIKNKIWLSCGLSGVDISFNNGKNWRNISKESFHTCHKAKHGKKVFLSGGRGKIGVLNI